MPSEGHIEHIPTGRNLIGVIVERRQPYQVFWGDKIVAFAPNMAVATHLLNNEAARRQRAAARRVRMPRTS